MSKVEKAYAITDAKISFVSLVDKAANKKQFLITKAEKGAAQFASYGRIINADAESHYVTGIVYEPLTEDAHGNYMTEEEITKAAYWFAKNGDQVDLQHSFEPLENAAVVESYVAPCEMEIGGEEIRKGTWIMTVEVSDPAIFEAIQKGEITGFSMGGVGKYSDEDVELTGGVEKGEEQSPAREKETRGIFKRLAQALGFSVVEKGEVADKYAAEMKASGFWTAFYTLEDVLYRYNRITDRWEFEDNESLVNEALSDFNAIVSNLLSGSDPIAKTLAAGSVLKAGKAMSSANKKTLSSIYESLGAFLEQFNDEEKEESEVTKKELDTIVKAVVEAMTARPATEGQVEKSAAPAPAAEKAITEADIKEMVADAVAKALAPKEGTPEPVTAENVKKMIDDAVEKALEPVRKAAGLPSNLNDEEDEDEDEIEKSEPHYLAGIL